MNGRGRHFEHKIWFLIINQVQPTLFTKNLSFIKFKRDLATETNEDNDFTTVIHIVIILCFIEHLCYPQRPAEMFSNVFILMECYLKLGPDVDHSDFTCYVCCFQTGWHCFQTWLVFRSKNRSLNACIEYKNWKDSFANQCSLDIYVYKHKTVL